jgi:hypothetical protein
MKRTITILDVRIPKITLDRMGSRERQLKREDELRRRAERIRRGRIEPRRID